MKSDNSTVCVESYITTKPQTLNTFSQPLKRRKKTSVTTT